MKIFIEKKYTNFSLVLKAILLHIYVTACTSHTYKFGVRKFDNFFSEETEKNKEWLNDSNPIGLSKPLSSRQFQRRNFFVSNGKETKKVEKIEEVEETEKEKESENFSFLSDYENDLEDPLEKENIRPNEFISFLEELYDCPGKSDPGRRTYEIFTYIKENWANAKANRAKLKRWSSIDSLSLKRRKSQLKFYCKDQEKTSRLILIFPYNKRDSTFAIQCRWEKNEITNLVGYATACYISNGISMTCAHALFEIKRREGCLKVIARNPSGQIINSSKFNYIPIPNKMSYSFRPLPGHDTATMLCDKEGESGENLKTCIENIKTNKHTHSVYTGFFVKLPDDLYFVVPGLGLMIEANSLLKKETIIHGYPSGNYNFSTSMEDNKVFKNLMPAKSSRGKLLEIKFQSKDSQEIIDGTSSQTGRVDLVLVYTNNTLGGMSGAAVLMKLDKNDNGQNKTTLIHVGSHSHRGDRKTNEGVGNSLLIYDRLQAINSQSIQFSNK